MFSMTTSARSAIRCTIRRPSGAFTLTAIERFPRFQPKKPGSSRNESPSSDSTLITCAPRSANIIAPYEPGMDEGRATTVMPCSGPVMPRSPRRDVARDELSMEFRVAVERLQGLRPLEIEMEVVFPGEADAAVDLDGVPRDVARRLTHVGLADRGGHRGVLRAGVERPRRVVDRGMRVLGCHEHVGAAVADRLERADRLSELLAHLRVLHAHVETASRGAQHLGRGADGGSTKERLEQGPRAAGLADDGVRLHGDARELHLRPAVGEIDAD